METIDKNAEAQSPSKPWQGYTIDELRFRRAYVLAHCEISKMRLLESSNAMRQGASLFSGGRGLMGKMLRSLNYVDYMLIAYRVGSKLYRLTRHKR